MPKAAGQKLKILYIMQCLMEESDESSPVSTARLIGYLMQYGIRAERKSIYDDIAALQDFGMDIITVKGKPGGYYLASREFELAELKLLVDAVQASKFVTPKKSRELIAKLEHLTNKVQAKRLHRQVVVAGRGKSENEQIYYNVDAIYDAIAANRQIRFQYADWSQKKELVPKKNGAFYQVSPWLLIWQDEKYYLLAFDDQARIIKYYRVDKMLKIASSELEREGLKEFQRLDLAGFAKKPFGMCAGEERKLSLRIERRLIGVMIDRFGTDVALRPIDERFCQVLVSVDVSPQFFGWLTGLGSGVVIQSPEDVREQYQTWLKNILEGYL